MASADASIRGLVEQALELPPDGRAAWLHDALDGDESRVADVLSIVTAAEVQDGFLDPPAAAAAVALPAPGDRIAGYEVVREIGRGGMGTVYEALQDVPRRRIALKVLSTGVASRRARERFRYEVEVLGALRHPSIAQLHEAGLGDGSAGLAWFAMEFVEGARTILGHAEAASLDRRSRLALFLDACRAVQAGHQQGIVHRDLKPDNLLVDANGSVKVIDFGVARVLDDGALEATLRTQADEIVGTLAYMGPEQVAGRPVDTRSDVYALGVVLFELLTGARPIDVRSTDLVTAARRIAESPPRRPAAIDASLRGDIEAILLTALEKDPDRRYASASALAADIARHLDGQPVAARRPTVGYHLAAFARRHKKAVAAAVVVVASLVAATIVSVRSAMRADREATTARTERDRFQQLFETQFDQGMEDVGTNARALLDQLGGAPAAKAMLARAIDRLHALEAYAHGDVAIQRGLASAYIELAVATGSDANPQPDVQPEVRRALGRALALLDALRERAPRDAQIRHAHVWATGLMAYVMAMEADADASTWEARARENAEDPEVSPLGRAQSALVVALAALARGDDRTQLEWIDRALEVPLGEERRGRLRREHLLARRAMCCQRLGKRQQANDDLVASLALLEGEPPPDAVALPRALELVRVRYFLGDNLMSLGRVDEALVRFEEAHAQAEALLRQAPGHLGVLDVRASTLRGLGQIKTAQALRRHGKGSPERRAGLAAALAHWEEALAILERIGAAGRLTAVSARNADQLRRMVATHRGVLGLPPREASATGDGAPTDG